MPVRYSSIELIRIITNEGWCLVSVRGSHHKYKHPAKSGIVVVPHPKSIVPTGTASNILKTAGCKKN
jgi:predicted RNA binding protein YcfA (HicA-like mRNA interferase family)